MIPSLFFLSFFLLLVEYEKEVKGMKQIFSYVGYFIVISSANILLFFLLGCVSYLLTSEVSVFYSFIVITLSCGFMYVRLSVDAIYKIENGIQSKKIEKIIISFFCLLFYLGFWGNVLYIVMSGFKAAI